MNWRRCARWILALAFVLLPRDGTKAAAQAQESPVDYAALSGWWKGSLSIRQRGKCSIDRGGRSDVQVELLLEVAADGSFRAGLAPTRVKKSPQLSWQGQFRPDLTFFGGRPSGCRLRNGAAGVSTRIQGGLRREEGQATTRVRGGRSRLS